VTRPRSTRPLAVFGALLVCPACGRDLSVASVEVGHGLVQVGDTVRLTDLGYSAWSDEGVPVVAARHGVQCGSRAG
jgi:hypothetical protein